MVIFFRLKYMQSCEIILLRSFGLPDCFSVSSRIYRQMDLNRASSVGNTDLLFPIYTKFVTLPEMKYIAEFCGVNIFGYDEYSESIFNYNNFLKSFFNISSSYNSNEDIQDT